MYIIVPLIKPRWLNFGSNKLHYFWPEASAGQLSSKINVNGELVIDARFFFGGGDRS